MEPGHLTIVAALITAAATVVGAVIGAYKDTLLALMGRRNPRAVTGTWEGSTRYRPEHSDEGLHDRTFVCTLTQRNDRIAGTLTSVSREKADTGSVYKVEGRALETEYVTLSVCNLCDGAINYATAILEVSKDLKEMHGHLVGRSRSLNGIVLGEIQFKKVSRSL